MTIRSPIFFRCQTDPPEEPPIEIAWAFVAPDELGVVSETHPIQPPPAWASDIRADAASAFSRGVSLADLRSFGTTPRRIAKRMNRIFRNGELVSTHPADDAALRRMFAAAGASPAFELRETDAATVIDELAQLQRISERSLVRAKRKAELRSSLDSRPETRVRYLATLWAALAGRVGPTRRS
jgi:hypothetical protein